MDREHKNWIKRGSIQVANKGNVWKSRIASSLYNSVSCILKERRSWKKRKHHFPCVIKIG